MNLAGNYLREARLHFVEITGSPLLNPYADDPSYLTSVHWRSFRKGRIKRAGSKCEGCGLSRERCHERYQQDLNVHHLNYLCLYKEQDSDTLVLCPQCHLVEECAAIGHLAFICTDGKRVRCVCGAVTCK